MLAQRAASEGPRWTRAVEDQPALISEEISSELGRSIYIVGRAQSRIDQATLANEMGSGKTRAVEINQSPFLKRERASVEIDNVPFEK